MRRNPMTLELFLTTVIEYKRFSKQLTLKNDEDLIETYDEKDYVAIHTRLRQRTPKKNRTGIN